MLSHFKNRRSVFLSIFTAICIIVVTSLAIVEPVLATFIVGAIVVLLTLPHTIFFIVLTAATLPLAASLALVSPIGIIPACDVAAILALLSYCIGQTRKNRGTTGVESYSLVQPINYLIILAVPYFVVAIMSVFFNDGAFATLAQRLEIILVWSLFGVLLYVKRAIAAFVSWFVAACIILSLAWISNPGVGGVLGVQKNPSGGVIAAGILVLLLSPMRNRWRLPGIAILCGGLLSTGSRGSMLGLAVGVLLLLFFVEHWKRVLIPFIGAAFSSALILSALPQSVTDRLFAQDDSGLYTVDIRGAFVADALAKFQTAPWSGIGIGNYIQTDPALLSVATRDPHNVLALSLAEGGYPLLGAFILLCVVSLLWLATKPKSSLLVLALAVQTSILVHALVDVYWVRGTPAIGWTFIGAACAQVYFARRSNKTETLQPAGLTS